MASVSLNTEDALKEQRNALENMFITIRNHPLFIDCPIVMFAECLPALAANHIAQDILHIGPSKTGNVITMKERRSKDRTEAGWLPAEGVPKDAIISAKLYQQLSSALANEYIQFATDWMTLPTVTREDTMKIMRTSLKNYRLEISPHGNRLREHYTAKVDGCSDDMFIAFQMTLYWPIIFWDNNSIRYNDWKTIIRQNGGVATRLF